MDIITTFGIGEWTAIICTGIGLILAIKNTYKEIKNKHQ